MLSEKKNKLLQIKLSETDYNNLQAVAFVYGTTPTQWVRQMIQMSINAFMMSNEKFKELNKNAESNADK